MKETELMQYLKDGMDLGFPPKQIINDAIKEIERLREYKKLMYNYNIEVYRCKCGTLALKGYLCSNEECTEE